MRDRELEMSSVSEERQDMAKENGSAKLTLAEVRAKLAGQTGKRYWRSIDELAGTPEFEAALSEEFPQQARSGSIRFRGAAS